MAKSLEGSAGILPAAEPKPSGRDAHAPLFSRNRGPAACVTSELQTHHESSISVPVGVSTTRLLPQAMCRASSSSGVLAPNFSCRP